MEGQPFSRFHIFLTKESLSHCGYCNSEDTSIVNGMWAYEITIMDYQNLLDRGWRRSGHYLYKPINQRTCCPMYTIRCDVTNFQLTKSQKKILKNMNRFLLRGKAMQDLCKTKEEEWKQYLDNYTGEMVPSYATNDLYDKNDNASKQSSVEYEGKERKASEEPASMEIGSTSGESGIKKEDKERKASKEAESREIDSTSGVSETKKGSCKATDEEFSLSAEDMSVTTKESDPSTACDTMQCISMKKVGSKDGTYRKKAKVIRRENKYQKLVNRGLNEREVEERLNNAKVTPQSLSHLEDYIFEMESGQNKLEVRLVRTSPKSKEYQKTAAEAFMLYKKYQVVVHGDKPNELRELDYEAFLVDSPLIASFPGNDPAVSYGSFHQQYWINGTLIAVGVIDILPYCVSSVYFFYDPDFRILSLGTYGALREISFVRNLKLSVPSIQFYYMGYYIHNCPKMKYKGHFSPSYLLCPETYTWHPIEKCLPKLEVSKYSRLEEDASVCDEDELVDLQRIIVNHRGIEMHYKTYRAHIRNAADEDIFRLYAKLIGTKCALDMLYLIM